MAQIRLAVIAAAGWKGTSSVFPNIEPGVPESLLPLGDGDTLLSRQARQLRALGFVVFATVGRPGCRFPWWGCHQAGLGHITKEGAKEGIDSSPWTWERVSYVAEHAIPIIVPDPDSFSRHASNCLAIEALGREWDRLLLTSGDHLSTDEFLQGVVSQPCPCQVVIGGHVLFWFDAAAARAYYGLSPRHLAARIWYRQDSLYAEYLLRIAPRRDLEGYGKRFMDIDAAQCYRVALQWVQKHG
ncbi:MAG: hypothetical protein GWN58_25615 [Anaerolineae bacterium]|nr:hypothetical protein [Anaerolineae bacterium]